MRKTIVTLAAIAVGAAAFGTVASPASADDPNVTYLQGGTMGRFPHAELSDEVQARRALPVRRLGLLHRRVHREARLPGEHGPLPGQAVRREQLHVHRHQHVPRRPRDHERPHPAVRPLRQRLRLERQELLGQQQVHHRGSSVIYPGQSASVQCNGVREARPYDGNTAKDYCNVKLSYRATDPRPRRPSAPRWVAASARTGPWTGVPTCVPSSAATPRTGRPRRATPAGRCPRPRPRAP